MTQAAVLAESGVQGSAKAWVNYKGTSTVSIRASYNVSSVTRVSAGSYTINFTNAFADANYCASLGVEDYNTIGPSSSPAPTTTAFNVNTRYPFDATARDVGYVYASFFR